MKQILETERLYLRSLCPEDAEILHDYRSDKRCYAYQRWEDTSLEWLRKFAADFRDDAFLSDKEEQHYAICTKEGALAGDLSYFYTPSDNCVTLGITISYAHHRRGYAFEMLQAVVAAVQTAHPGLDIVALIDKENAPSIALFEKLGFRRECYAESIGSFVYIIYGKNEKEG